MPLLYKKGGVKVSIGQSSSVQTPARILRARLRGTLFDTDKTFILPGAMHSIRQLIKLWASHPTVHGLVNGHTDTQADASYNLGLSDGRAKSVAQFLKDDVEGWMGNYSVKPFGKVWGTREDQSMMATVLAKDGTPFYTGPIDGIAGGGTSDGYKRLQNEEGLAATGQASSDTRRALVRRYMALDGTTLPASAPAPLTHGCGLFHLEVQTGPNVAEQANRRVEVFLFDGEVDPPPRDKCPSPGCPEYEQWKGNALKTVDLEDAPSTLIVKVTDERGQPVANAQVKISGIVSAEGKSGSDGVARIEDLMPGDYHIVAELPARVPGETDATAQPGDTNATVMIPGSDLQILGANEDSPEGRVFERKANHGEPLRLCWRVWDDFQKVEIFNKGSNLTADVTVWTIDADAPLHGGTLPLVPDDANADPQNASGGDSVASYELRVTRKDGNSDKPKQIQVTLIPASSVQGGTNCEVWGLANAVPMGFFTVIQV